MKRSERKYIGVSQHFHNYEHDPEGLTHCRGPASNPYRIVHYKGHNIISTEYARGHGKKKETQWFRFEKRLGPGWSLASGIMVAPEDVPEKGKTKLYFKIGDRELVLDESRLKSKLPHEVIKDRLKILSPQRIKGLRGREGSPAVAALRGGRKKNKV